MNVFYNTSMNSSEEKKNLKRSKLKYFVAVMLAYLCVYVILACLLNWLAVMVTIPVYVQFGLFVFFFFLSIWPTKLIVRRRFVMDWVTRN
jgi:fatty acid desaturase